MMMSIWVVEEQDRMPLESAKRFQMFPNIFFLNEYDLWMGKNLSSWWLSSAAVLDYFEFCFDDNRVCVCGGTYTENTDSSRLGKGCVCVCLCSVLDWGSERWSDKKWNKCSYRHEFDVSDSVQPFSKGLRKPWTSLAMVAALWPPYLLLYCSFVGEKHCQLLVICTTHFADPNAIN